MVKNMELADLLGGKMRFKNDPPRMDDIIYGMQLDQKQLFGMISDLCDCIRGTQESVKALQRRIAMIAPDLDVIECMAEDEREEQMLTDLYLNRRENYYEVMDKYQTVVEEELKKARKGMNQAEYEDVRDIALMRIENE